MKELKQQIITLLTSKDIESIKMGYSLLFVDKTLYNIIRNSKGKPKVFDKMCDKILHNEELPVYHTSLSKHIIIALNKFY